MGVYIPNISKPKECGECLFFMLDGVITDDNEWISYSVCDLLGKTIGDADMLNDCPLIDIVTCGECEYADEYNHCKYSAWWNGNADFCSHGIRRKESQ